LGYFGASEFKPEILCVARLVSAFRKSYCGHQKIGKLLAALPMLLSKRQGMTPAIYRAGGRYHGRGAAQRDCRLIVGKDRRGLTYSQKGPAEALLVGDQPYGIAAQTAKMRHHHRKCRSDRNGRLDSIAATS
jgi:hypothetical protein